MKNFIKILAGIIVGIILCWLVISKINSKQSAITTHQEVIEKIEAMGKLELAKINIRDIMEHKVVRQWLPNPSAILIISGEVVGCIDFQKIKQEDITISKDTLMVRLPAPEICYCKIDHQKSKVYEIKNHYFLDEYLVNEAYKEAEKQLQKTALSSGILEYTKQNAVNILTPFFKAFGFKHVEILF